jgi:hypothetical protein
VRTAARDGAGGTAVGDASGGRAAHGGTGQNDSRACEGGAREGSPAHRNRGAMKQPKYLLSVDEVAAAVEQPAS